MRYIKRQHKGLSLSLIGRPQDANTKLGHSKSRFAKEKKGESPSYQILMWRLFLFYIVFLGLPIKLIHPPG
jgi:hypothetical protein